MARSKPKKRRKQPLRNAARWRIPPPVTEGTDDPDIGLAVGMAAARFARKAVVPIFPAEMGTAWTAKASANAMQAGMDKLAREYYARLAELPRFARCADIPSMDTLDLRGVRLEEFRSAYVMDEAARRAMDAVHPAYAFAPCYPEGAIMPIKRNPDDADSWITFEILSVDEDAGSYSVRLRDWHPGEGYSLPFVPGTGCDASIRTARRDGTSYVDHIVLPDGISGYLDLYSCIPPKDLGWTENDCTFWTRTYLQAAADSAGRYAKAGRDPADDLARTFIQSVLISNYYLFRERPAVERTPRGRGPGKAPPPAGAPARRVRTVGPVRFVSSRPPKPAAADTRNYTAASWTVRGHIRRYKSGKAVYVRPSIAHRKALEDKDAPAERAGRTLRIDPGTLPDAAEGGAAHG